MRLVFTTGDPKEAQMIASFLGAQGIENLVEMTTNSDWGTADYGTSTCNVWVYNEDQLDATLAFVEQFKEDKNNPIFKNQNGDAFKLQVSIDPSKSSQNKSFIESLSTKNPVLPFKFSSLLNSHENDSANQQGKKNSKNSNSLKNQRSLTSLFLAICCFLFIFSQLTAPSLNELPNNLNLPYTPITASPIKKELLYDYPKSYELLDKIIKLYGIEKLQNVQDLPQEGQFLFKKYYETPYWQGLYDLALNKMQGNKEPVPFPPMFEKIREGQVWRLLTPALLHSDILHLVFNMLWLIILGKQIEQRISGLRYLLMIILLAIFSNTCQYLMSGANFLGFSGVITGMLTFIWMRQKLAPWEGYPLQRSTFLFLIYFIFAMFLIQVVSFFLEARNSLRLSPGIANTAHLSGAAFGLVLSSFSFFSWKPNNFTSGNSKRQSK